MNYDQIEEENRRDYEYKKHDTCKAELRRLCEFIRTGEIVAANVMASQIYEREEWGND